jgi:hypothetical protein
MGTTANSNNRTLVTALLLNLAWEAGGVSSENPSFVLGIIIEIFLKIIRSIFRTQNVRLGVL